MLWGESLFHPKERPFFKRSTKQAEKAKEVTFGPSTFNFTERLEPAGS
jgi:hypothetical protein